MNNGLISARYATALLEYSNNAGVSNKVYDEAKIVIHSFEQFNTLKSVLENPVLSKVEKLKVIELAAGGKLSKFLQKFFDLLLNSNREAHLQAIMLRYLELYRKQQNIHSGKLTTATQIDKSTEKRLVSMIQSITGGEVEIEKKIDPAILGGFQFEVDFVRWDASLKAQLQRIKNEYIDKNKRMQ
jgi:F-type H+-transporting ATPase subunit delta